MDPQGVNLHSDSKNNASQLDILQGVRQNILKHHKRFTDKTLNHIVYIDKELWECFSNNALAASLVTLSSPMDKIMLYLFFGLLWVFLAVRFGDDVAKGSPMQESL
jgi:hypothetical protein